MGGVRYWGTTEAAHGKYIFGDNYSGKIFAIDPDQPEKDAETLARLKDVAMRGLTTIRQSPDGGLWMSTLGDQTSSTGRLWELVPAEKVVAADEPEPAKAVGPANGGSLFTTNCAICHGRGGKGLGHGAESGPKVPDFSDPAFHASRSDTHLRKAIAGGGTAVGLSAAMPPWGQVLSDKDIDALVEHIRSLKAADGN